MINLYQTQIQSISLHKVGNKSRNEQLFLSAEPYNLTDEINVLLKEYFLKPFREKEESYFKFSHEVAADLNYINSCCSAIFENPKKAHNLSKQIAKHLYDQAKHPHIKSGEVYVCYFTDVVYNNEKVDAIGIFKSELKPDFIQFKEADQNLDILLRQGVNLNKLDKGCLVLNTNKDDGYRVLAVDGNRYDTKYWLTNFLELSPLTDTHFYTKKYLKFCQNFAKDVVASAEGKQNEVLFINKAVHHFASNDEFNEANFLKEVLDNPELEPEFKHYKTQFAPKYNLEHVSAFEIANNAVTAVRKTIKPLIKLDTNVQIKVDFINPESAEKFIEKGWDEERQMYYYLVYFNKETN